MFELFMYVYSCNALSARFFTVGRALNSYFMIMIMILSFPTFMFYKLVIFLQLNYVKLTPLLRDAACYYVCLLYCGVLSRQYSCISNAIFSLNCFY